MLQNLPCFCNKKSSVVFFFSHCMNMANSEAFCRVILSRMNFLFLKSVHHDVSKLSPGFISNIYIFHVTRSCPIVNEVGSYLLPCLPENVINALFLLPVFFYKLKMKYLHNFIKILKFNLTYFSPSVG